MKKFFEEFKKFAIKGNMIDLAIGVVIGSAFNSIVSSLANSIIMPLLSIVIGRINIKTLSVTIPSLIKGFEPIELKYGEFLQAIVNFLIISFSIFLYVKLISKFNKKDPEPEEKALTHTEELLTDIRDLLREKSGE